MEVGTKNANLLRCVVSPGYVSLQLLQFRNLDCPHFNQFRVHRT